MTATAAGRQSCTAGVRKESRHHKAIGAFGLVSISFREPAQSGWRAGWSTVKRSLMFRLQRIRQLWSRVLQGLADKPAFGGVVSGLVYIAAKLRAKLAVMPYSARGEQIVSPSLQPA